MPLASAWVLGLAVACFWLGPAVFCWLTFDKPGDEFSCAILTALCLSQFVSHVKNRFGLKLLLARVVTPTLPPV